MLRKLDSGLTALRNRSKRRRSAVALAGALLATASAWSDGPRPKKVIYGGTGDLPRSGVLVEHLQSTFQNRPFDGLTFLPDSTTQEDYFWQVNPSVQFEDPNNPDPNDPNILATFGLSNMAALAGQWGRFSDDFLYLNAGYHAFTWATLDWFDDNQWREHVIPALKVYAHAAQSAGCMGVWIEVESFGTVWHDWGAFCYKFYDDDPNFMGSHDPNDPPNFWQNYPGHSALECRQQVRQRGRECMDAIQSEFPNVRIFMVAALSSELGLDFDAQPPEPNDPNYQEHWDHFYKHAAHAYYLLPAFVAGMLERADGARIVDGFQGTYYYLTTDSYFPSDWYGMLRNPAPTVNDAMRLLADPNDPNATALAQQKWWTHCEVGTDVQPEFVDQHRDAIDLADYLTHNFVNALALSEQYCWLWVPGPWNHFWDPNDPNMSEPNQAVKTALEAAPGIYSGQALGFDINVVNNQVVETNDPNVNLTIAYDMDDPAHVFVSATATAYSPYTFPVTHIDLYQNGLPLASLSGVQLILNQNGLTWTWSGGVWLTLANGTYEFGARAFEPSRGWSNTSRFRKITVNVNHGEGG